VEIETLAAAPDQWRSMGRWCSAIRSWAAFHLQACADVRPDWQLKHMPDEELAPPATS